MRNHYRSQKGAYIIGYLLKDDEEDRRDKRRCIHFEDGHCNHKCMKCPGSNECGIYRERCSETKSTKTTKVYVPSTIWDTTICVGQDFTKTNNDTIDDIRHSILNYSVKLNKI